MPDKPNYDEFFAEEHMVNSGNNHTFFGYTTNRSHLPDLPEKLPERVRPKNPSDLDPIHIHSGNILYIPQLQYEYDEDTIYWIVDSAIGMGKDYQIAVKPITNVLTGNKYTLHLGSGILKDKTGLYNGLALHLKDRIGEIPGYEPISDYYLCMRSGMSEEVLVRQI